MLPDCDNSWAVSSSTSFRGGELGIHNHRRAKVPIVGANLTYGFMDSGLAPELVIGPAGGRTRWARPAMRDQPLPVR